MNCPNCGRVLMEGEVCNCTENVQNEAVESPATEPIENETAQEAAPADAAVSEAAPQTNYYQPPQQPYYSPEQAQQNYYQQPQQQAYYQPPVAPVMPQPVMEMPARTDYPEGYKIKRKYVAVILAACLGYIGIHHFYLGDKTKGIIKILLTTLGALVVVGPIIAYVWSIVDAVLLLTENEDKDANGFKIQTFEEALVAERMKAEAKAAEDEE